MADWEEAAGISAPLYEIVDTVFELQSRGFFRRQVTTLSIAYGRCTARSAWSERRLARRMQCMGHVSRCIS